MFGMKRLLRNRRGMDSAILKIVFVTVSLVLAAVAVKTAYSGYIGSQALVNISGTTMSPDQAVSNLTQTIAGNI